MALGSTLDQIIQSALFHGPQYLCMRIWVPRAWTTPGDDWDILRLLARGAFVLCCSILCALLGSLCRSPVGPPALEHVLTKVLTLASCTPAKIALWTLVGGSVALASRMGCLGNHQHHQKVAFWFKVRLKALAFAACA